MVDRIRYDCLQLANDKQAKAFSCACGNIDSHNLKLLQNIALIVFIHRAIKRHK